jgi:hypothetical protein
MRNAQAISRIQSVGRNSSSATDALHTTNLHAVHASAVRCDFLQGITMSKRTFKVSYKHKNSNSHANTEHTVNSSDSESSSKHKGKLELRGSSNDGGEARAASKNSKTISTTRATGQLHSSDQDEGEAICLTNIARNGQKHKASATSSALPVAATRDKIKTVNRSHGSKNKKALSAFSASASINRDVPPTHTAIARAMHASSQPQLRSIDTIELDADLADNEIEAAIERLRLMVNTKTARRVTRERRFWKRIYSVPLGTDRQGDRGVSLTFYFVCTANNADVPMRLQFNVGLIQESHARRFIEVFREVFPFDYQRVARCLRVHGTDEAYDHIGSLEDFILERPRTTTVERYFIKTNAGGAIQTSYIGGVNSPSHGVLYDLGSADAYRNALGQPVALNKDTATHTFVEREGMIRIESRRVFPKSLTMQQLLKLPSAFHEYLFFDLTRLPRRERRDPVFMGYVDSVRLRGLNSAGKRLAELFGGGRAAKRQVKEFEDRLASCRCAWWQALDHQQKLGVLLRSAPIWCFLKHTAKPD